MASFSVYRAEFRDGSVEMWSQKETIAWGPCTPPPTLETFSKKISLSTRSSIEIAGLLKKKLMMNMMTEIRGTPCFHGFSRASLKVGRNGLGLCMAGNASRSC